jgi:pyruvate formate lyase activating enzyme
VRRSERRRFLQCGALALAAAACPAPAGAFWPVGPRTNESAGAADIRGTIFKGDAPASPGKWSKEGFSYERLAGGKVVCGVCPNRCALAPGDRSVCRSKVNLGGTLYTLAYGNPCAVNVDPIEKKPLFHYKPRTRAFTIATTGCSFRCLNCQNWEISQAKPHEVRHVELFPPDVVSEALRSGSASVAYSYSEATTYFEYMIDTARLARDHGLGNCWISNGFINRAPLLELCKVLSAANVNLKSFSDEIYRKLNGGRLQPVLDTLVTLHERGVHFEMTNLVVPGYVDDPELVKRMCGWIVANLGPDHPLHFLRFFPLYKLDRLAPTPQSTLEDFRKLAMAEGIRYVYIGNVPNHEGANTWCHNCRKLLVERRGYAIPTFEIKDGVCRYCGTAIPGVWA